jgi:hypothetical protein
VRTEALFVAAITAFGDADIEKKGPKIDVPQK